LGAYADLTDPKSALFLLPVIALAVVGTWRQKNSRIKTKHPQTAMHGDKRFLSKVTRRILRLLFKI
jgi:hypothetical protein